MRSVAFAVLATAWGVMAETRTGSTYTSYQVSLAPFTIELSADQKSPTGDHLVEFRRQTLAFLDKQFAKYFQSYFSTEIENNGYDYSRMSLTIRSFTLDEVDTIHSPVTYHSTASFEGTAFFTSLPIPSRDFMKDLQVDLFSGDSKQEYLTQIQEADNSFLDKIEDITAIFPIPNASSKDDPNSSDSDVKISMNMIIIIAASAGGAVIFAILSFCMWRKCVVKKSGGSSDEKGQEKSMSEIPDVELASTGSMDSSKFTYNVYTNQPETGGPKTLPSLYSDITNDTGIKNMNVDAWRSGTAVGPLHPAPFENDISAIVSDSPNKTIELGAREKTLSFIQEATQESSTNSSYLSKDNISRQSKESNGRRTAAMEEMMDEFSMMSDNSDVMADLKNLSVQIRRQRSGVVP
eukprot:scaffold69635_cov58-Attheya_sp.AAC.2